MEMFEGKNDSWANDKSERKCTQKKNDLVEMFLKKRHRLCTEKHTLEVYLKINFLVYDRLG